MLQFTVILKWYETRVYGNQTIVCVLVNGKFISMLAEEILWQQRKGFYCPQLLKGSSLYFSCHTMSY